MGATLMDGLDTLLLAGLESEVHEAELWLASHFDVNKGRVGAMQRLLSVVCVCVGERACALCVCNVSVPSACARECACVALRNVLSIASVTAYP